MRLLTTFLILCFIINNSLAADTTIVFRPISYSEVFELAKQEQKAVFMYFHFDGCGACVNMEKTAFVNKRVTDFYNENFICFEVNTRKGEGIEINKIYNVKLHPSFLYMDENGEILHKIVGIYSPEEFVLQAQTSLDPANTMKAFKRQYQHGNREAEFLLDYCYKLRNSYELDSLRINEYLATQTLEDFAQERNIKFIYEFAVHNFNITIPINSSAFQFLLEHKDKFETYFEADQVATRIIWILNSVIYQAIENLDDSLFNKVIEILSDFDNGKMHAFKEMDGRTTGMITSKNLVLSSKMAFYEKSGDTKMFQAALKQYLDIIWDDSNALNTLAWDYYEHYEDKERIGAALNWVKRSIELNINYANQDTYAALLYKFGEYDTALQQAEKAIDIAKKDGKDYRGTIELIEKIKEKI